MFPQSQLDTEGVWTRHHDFRQGAEGATQVDYLLASLNLKCRMSSHLVTLEAGKDNSDHRRRLGELATFIRKVENKRAWVSPARPKMVGWSLYTQFPRKTHTTHRIIAVIFWINWTWGDHAGDFRDG